MSLKFRLTLLSLAGIAPIVLGIFFYILPMMRSEMVEQKRNEIKVVADLFALQIEKLSSKLQDKIITQEQFLVETRDLVHNYRYNKSDYVFIYDYNGTHIAHGLDPSLEGKNKLDGKDIHGVYYVQEMIKAIKNQGSGYVTYFFPKAVGSAPIEKTSYVKAIKGQDMFVGTGVYTDSIDAYVYIMQLKILAGLAALVCAIASFGLFFSTKISQQLTDYSQRIVKVVNIASGLASTLSAASGNLASSSQEQAAAIQESVSALSEMSSMISQTGQNVEHSLKSSHEATQETAEGTQAVELLTSSIIAIQKTNEQMQEISSVIANIGEKTSVINDIVFKTQLLSFNASIEAARAGAHGKGFSVVAEEVSNLAELSGEAAKEIEHLLQESQSKVHHTLEQIQLRITDTAKTNKIVQRSFESIAELVKTMETQLQSIREASKQQELGIQQTNAAMRQMEAAAEDNRASSEKTHSASEELSRESNALSSLTNELGNFVVGGTKTVDAISSTETAKYNKAPATVIDLEKIVASVSSMKKPTSGKTPEVEDRAKYFRKSA